MRVCQFRHDGNLGHNAAAAARPPSQEDQLCYFTVLLKAVKHENQILRIVIPSAAVFPGGAKSLPCSCRSPERSRGGTRRDLPLNRSRALAKMRPCRQISSRQTARATSRTYPSFAVIEIFAFRTFDTGQPFSAASAYF